MANRIQLFTLLLLISTLSLLAGGGADSMLGADHTDAPALAAAKRDDARLTDFHAFIRKGNLVLAESLNPAIPTSVSKYVFASDLTIQFNIDNHSQVSFDNPADVKTYGGTVLRPDQIKEDIVFTVTFNDRGDLQLNSRGLAQGASQSIRVFAGLRDDPFLVARWDSYNTASIVLEFPLSLVIKSQPTLLLWDTSKVPGFDGPFQDLDARALRSQGDNRLNTVHPSQHMMMFNVPPDVMILDTSKPVMFPNGRELTDDLSSIMANPPRPPDQWRKNDVPFLDEFPYLGNPWPPR